MEKVFGNKKAIFVNQDEGMFVAFPVTFDEDVLDLELDTRNGRRIVKAGSLVLDKQNILGITAEEYDITDGPKVGRVVVEGYAWAEGLTTLAKAGAAELPRIVLYPVQADGSEVDGVPDYFKVTLSGDGLSADLDDLDEVRDGTEIVITITPAEGKEVDTFTVGGTDKKSSISEGKYTFTVTDDVTVAVTYSDIQQEEE